MIHHLESELAERVEYFQAEQFGSIGGRIHQHIGVSAPSLEIPAQELATILATGGHKLPDSLKPFQAFLWDNAGFNRILPWEADAGYYIGRYVGRDADRCHWEWNVLSNEKPDSREALSVGRVVVARSADLPSASFRRGVLKRWHR